MSLLQAHFMSDGRLEAYVDNAESSLSRGSAAYYFEEIVIPYLELRAIQRFRNEGDAASGRWAPLKPKTQQTRAQYGYGAQHPINIRTGRLEDFIVGGNTGYIAGFGLEWPGPAPDSAIEQKFATAQLGRAHPQTVPRPVVALSEDEVLYLTDRLESYIWSRMRSSTPSVPHVVTTPSWPRGEGGRFLPGVGGPIYGRDTRGRFLPKPR